MQKNITNSEVKTVAKHRPTTGTVSNPKIDRPPVRLQANRLQLMHSAYHEASRVIIGLEVGFRLFTVTIDPPNAHCTLKCNPFGNNRRLVKDSTVTAD